MRDIEYGVTYYFEDGPSRREKTQYLDSDQEAPDITTLALDDKIWCVQIGFSQPLEHPLILRDGATINPYGHEWDFYAYYFPDAEIVPYGAVNGYMTFQPETIQNGFSEHTREVIQYGYDFAGSPLYTPEELIYVNTKIDMFAVLNENAAILTPAKRNGNGVLWQKKNNFHLRYGL